MRVLLRLSALLALAFSLGGCFSLSYRGESPRYESAGYIAPGWHVANIRGAGRGYGVATAYGSIPRTAPYPNGGYSTYHYGSGWGYPRQYGGGSAPAHYGARTYGGGSSYAGWGHRPSAGRTHYGYRGMRWKN